MNNDKAETGANTLASLKQQRSTMKRNITQLKLKIEKDGGSWDYTILECRLQILESYFKQISHIQAQIEKLDDSDLNRSEIEELFISAKAPLVNFMNGKRNSGDIEQSFLSTTQSVISHHHRLPQIKLPKFDGKYSEFSRFMSTFNTLVHNDSSISTIDKFNYLLNCVSGQALALIEPLPVIEVNYQKALNSLIERYDNKSLIFIDYINSLFSIPHMTKPDATLLRSILDNVSALRSSLLSLGSEVDVMNAIIIHIVLSKVDVESKNVYDEKQDFKTLPSWDQCLSILNRRCQFLESRSAEMENIQSRTNKPKQISKRTGSAFVVSTIFCEYCKSKDHSIGTCSSYLSLPVARRFDFVKTAKLCINCLRRGHVVAQCSSKSRCRSCKVSHHTSLHNTNVQSPSNASTSSHQHHSPLNSSLNHYSSSPSSFRSPHTSLVQPSFSSSTQSTLPTQSNPASNHLTKVSSFLTRTCRINLLPTAVVLVKDSFGNLQPFRALLDSCSEVNLITQEAVNRLRLKQNKSTQEVSGISNIRTLLKHFVTATIKSRVTEFEWTTTFLVTKSISAYHPPEQITISNWNLPHGIELADPQFNMPQRVDLLISSEIFFELILNGKFSLGNGLPCFINTTLGWIIGGSVNTQRQQRTLSCNILTKTEDLDSLLKRFWEIEEFKQNSSIRTEEERLCEEHFMQNTIFDPTGRVQVRLPFKTSITQLGNSMATARRRLMYLEKRLSKDENLRQMYSDFMDEYIQLGHMSPVSFNCLDSPHYIIPHHAVLRPQSTTTKLRVVFDASCPTSTNISLNETLWLVQQCNRSS